MKYAENERFTLFHGDNRAILPTLPENSVDAIVTDPPYELGFMGKSWDASGIAFNVEVWQECLRVLKPGGHLLAFSGSRTYHRMAVAIEDAGFEIRDQIMWIYGSGFPKSHDVSKGIDKQAGAERNRELKWVAIASGSGNYGGGAKGGEMAMVQDDVAITAEAKQWQGWGTALKPAHEPIVVARKPLIGTVAANVLTYGTGGLNIDSARVGTEVRKNNINDFSNQHGNQFGNGAAIPKLGESEVIGRWPANVIHDGSDEVVELFPDTAPSKAGIRRNKSGMGIHDSEKGTFGKGDVFGGFNDSGSAARFFYCAKASKRDRNEGCESLSDKEWRDEGAAIPERKNRPFLPSKNHHPTVKPTSLMQYLCKLVTPPGGVVLDPFVGSGSTGKAAMYEGFNFVGIEMTEEYLPIAKARIEFALGDDNADI